MARALLKGRGGAFLACSAFPKCRNAKPLPENLREKPKETGEACDKCGLPMVQKTSRWGKEFIACSGYPECKNTRNVDEAAPKEDGGGEDGEPEVEAAAEPAEGGSQEG